MVTLNSEFLTIEGLIQESTLKITRKDIYSYYDVEGNLRFVSSYNYFHVTLMGARELGDVDDAQVRR